MVSYSDKVAAEDGIHELQEILAGYKELGHIQVRKRGGSLILYSGHPEDEEKHARMTYLGQHAWGLSFPRHAGGWEPAPFVGSLKDLTETLVRDFGLFLTQAQQ